MICQMGLKKMTVLISNLKLIQILIIFAPLKIIWCSSLAAILSDCYLCSIFLCNRKRCHCWVSVGWIVEFSRNQLFSSSFTLQWFLPCEATLCHHTWKVVILYSSQFRMDNPPFGTFDIRLASVSVISAGYNCRAQSWYQLLQLPTPSGLLKVFSAVCVVSAVQKHKPVPAHCNKLHLKVLMLQKMSSNAKKLPGGVEFRSLSPKTAT